MNSTRLGDWLTLVANLEHLDVCDEQLAEAPPKDMYLPMATWADGA